MLTWQLDQKEHTSAKFESKCKTLYPRKYKYNVLISVNEAISHNILWHIEALYCTFVSELCHNCFAQWSVACLVLIHYLHQCKFSIDCTLKNKLQWKCHQNAMDFVFVKMPLKISSATYQPFSSGFKVSKNPQCALDKSDFIHFFHS